MHNYLKAIHSHELSNIRRFKSFQLSGYKIEINAVAVTADFIRHFRSDGVPRIYWERWIICLNGQF
jgi:hypothetical protein